MKICLLVLLSLYFSVSYALADEWKDWKPENDFQELALRIHDYNSNCHKNYKFNLKGKTIYFKTLETSECFKKHREIMNFIYEKFPMIRSGEI